MTSVNFCYWLQGFFEISDVKAITPEQVKVIRNHLNMVFKHEIDPSLGDEEHQKELDAAHAGEQTVSYRDWRNEVFKC